VRKMNAYLELMLIGFKRKFMFRLDFLATLFSPFIFMLVYFFVWNSIFSYNNLTEIGGLSLAQMIAYMSISMSMFFSIVPRTDDYISFDVREGKFSSILTKPTEIQKYIFFRDTGEIVFGFLFMTLPAIAGAAFLFHIPLPNMFVFASFLISVILSYMVSFSIAFIAGLSVFWTEFSQGVIRFKDIVQNFFSGAIIPIYIFPEFLKSIAFILPFHVIVDTPVSIFIGKISGVEIITSILYQLLWSIALIAIGYIILKHAVKRYGAQGG